MADLFYNPRPAVSFLTLRTNAGFNGGRTMRNFPHASENNQPLRLPLAIGLAPEIPQSILNAMIGNRMSNAAWAGPNATSAANRATSELQSTHVF